MKKDTWSKVPEKLSKSSSPPEVNKNANLDTNVFPLPPGAAMEGSLGHRIVPGSIGTPQWRHAK